MKPLLNTALLEVDLKFPKSCTQPLLFILVLALTAQVVQAQSSDAGVFTGGASFHGVFDYTISLGFNVGTRETYARTRSMPMWKWMLEYDYSRSPGEHLVEANLDLQATNGVYRRFVQVVVNRENPDAEANVYLGINGQGRFKVATSGDGSFGTYSRDLLTITTNGVARLEGSLVAKSLVISTNGSILFGTNVLSFHDGSLYLNSRKLLIDALGN